MMKALEVFDANLDLGLREEHGSLLDYLRWSRWLKLVTILCLAWLYMEMSVHNNLISQLEDELTRYQSEVSELTDRQMV